MRTSTIAFGLGLLAATATAAPFKATESSTSLADTITATSNQGRDSTRLNPLDQDLDFVSEEEFDAVDPDDSGPIISYAEIARRVRSKYPDVKLAVEGNEECREVAIVPDPDPAWRVEPYWLRTTRGGDPATDITVSQLRAALEPSSSLNVTERQNYFGPMNPYDQVIEHVTSSEYEAINGGPPVPHSELIRRIHLEHPSVAIEVIPNEACKEVKPDCAHYGSCELPFWLCAQKPELFGPFAGHPWPNITFVNEQRFSEQPGEAVPLRQLWTLEQGIHPDVQFTVEYSEEYAGINDNTPCMGVVIDCLAGPPCWRSQWTCQKPTLVFTDEIGTHIHNETLVWDGEQTVHVLKRDLDAGSTTVTGSPNIITVHPTVTETGRPTTLSPSPRRERLGTPILGSTSTPSPTSASVSASTASPTTVTPLP
jgi:hypothetical protein